jgi:hypothetical protein
MNVKFDLLLWGEKHELQVSGDKVLRKIPGPKKCDVSGQFKISHDKELGNLYRSHGVRRMK